MIPFHWKVGDNIYYNDIAAYKAATSTNKEPEFVVSAVKDSPLWRKEPPHSVYTYMDMVSRDIADKYENIILMYSGGTDSHTILESFIRCGIRNVTLMMIDTEEQDRDFDRVIINSWTKDTLSKDYKYLFTEWGYKFKTFTDGDSSLINLKKDALVDSLHTYVGSFLTNVKPSTGGARFKPVSYASSDKKTALVFGYEKPLITVNDNWFCWTASSDLAYFLNTDLEEDSENIFFYFSEAVPELQIKLAWLKLKEIVSILTEYNIPINKYNVEEIQSIHMKYSIYSRINRACGYRGLNHNLDTAASKESPLKARSNHASVVAGSYNGNQAIMKSFLLNLKYTVDSRYLETNMYVPTSLNAKPIKMREV